MKGQSRIVLETLQKMERPFTCREITFACGFDDEEAKNVSVILHNLIAQGKITEKEKRECAQSGRVSKTYEVKREVVSTNNTTHRLVLEGGKVIHITIKIEDPAA